MTCCTFKFCPHEGRWQKHWNQPYMSVYRQLWTEKLVISSCWYLHRPICIPELAAFEDLHSIAKHSILIKHQEAMTHIFWYLLMILDSLWYALTSSCARQRWISYMQRLDDVRTTWKRGWKGRTFSKASVTTVQSWLVLTGMASPQEKVVHSQAKLAK